MGRKYNRSSEADIILEILARIPVSNRHVSADEIVRSLTEAGIEISLRSTQRYLKQMSDSGKYGIVRDTRGSAYGYRRERSDTQFDSINLRPNECLLLRLAQEHMRYQMPGAVLKSLDFLFDAAEKKLNEQGRNAKERNWLKKVCVLSSCISQIPPKILPRIFDSVSEALYEEKMLRVEYTNNEGKTTKAAVSPLGLVQQDSRLYLICQFEHFDNVVHLALHRFKHAEVSDFPAVRPKDFDLHGYVNDRHFNFSNGAWIHWILEFESDQTARNLIETPFNTSQVLEKNEEGIWHLEVDIQDSVLLDGWVAMWKEKAGIRRSEKQPIDNSTPQIIRLSGQF